MAHTPSAPRAESILEDLPFCLARASLSFRRFNDQTLRSVGLESLTPGLASVLHALAECDDCTVNHLVETTHLPNGTLTGLLDELEKNGYIERHRNPADGRSWLVRLTKEGRRLCAKLQKRHRLVMHVLSEALSETEMADLTRLLGKVTTCMRTHVAEDDQSQRANARPKAAARTSR